MYKIFIVFCLITCSITTLSAQREPMTHAEISELATKNAKPYLNLVRDDTLIAASIYGEIYFKDIKNDYNQYFLNHAAQYIEKLRMDNLSGDLPKQYLKKATDQYLLNLVLTEEAKNNNLNTTLDEVDNQLLKLKNMVGEDKFQNIIKNEGGIENFRKNTLKKLTQTLVFQKWDNEAAEPTQDDLENFYQTYKEKFTTPAMIRFSSIWLKNHENDSQDVREKNIKLIQDLREQISSGKRDFAKVAKNFSDDKKSRNKGGDSGWLELAKLPDQYKPLLNQKIGEISPVFRLNTGCYIAMVTDKKEAAPIPLEKIIEKLKIQLYQANKIKLRSQKLKKLYDEAKVKYNIENVIK